MADHSDDDLDALFEDDPAEADYDRKRRAELLRDQEQKKGDFGTYMEKDEKALIDDTTKGCAVVHFAKEDFFRCGVMDTHLRSLAKAHPQTKFFKINVDNCPFLVAHYKVQVLPCVIAFIDGAVKDRIVGFEGLGRNPDTFTTLELESRLLSSQVIQRDNLARAGSAGQKVRMPKETRKSKGFLGYKSKSNGRSEEDSDADEWD